MRVPQSARGGRGLFERDDSPQAEDLTEGGGKPALRLWKTKIPEIKQQMKRGPPPDHK